ncbi:ABC transporter substrate-binding protein [Marinicrinis lubricantis]|uniref:ABC transporter substrate-binding protein n=1 Tax=Marinicrinis lubricantis TaxID=2086470 RepID=A0ABW1IL29_9BACL
MKKSTAKMLMIIFIVSTLVTTLAACGSGNNGGNENNTNTNTNANTNTNSGNGGEGSGEDTNAEPITLSWFSVDPISSWNNMQDEVGKELTKKTGVTLEAEFAMDANRIALMIASGDYPDMISPKGDASKLVDAGALIDLRDLIEEHGPNLKKAYEKYWDRLRWSAEDDAIYILPTAESIDQQYMDIAGSFHLQHAAVKEAGYPDIKTVKDYEAVIQQYVDQHPTTADGQPTIGLTVLADDWRIMIGVTNPAFYTTGAPDDGEFHINQETYEVTYHYRRPEEKEYFRWLNHMNDIGLLDREAFVQKEDQYKAKIASGRVVGVIDQDWGFQDSVNALKAEGKFEQTYAHFPVTLTEEYKDHSLQSTGFMAGWGIGITTEAEDPVRAIQFLDYLASEEGQILNNWGIEGKHYMVDENGTRVIPDEVLDRKVNDATNFTKESGIGMYSISARYGDGVKDSSGNYYTTKYPEQIIQSYSDVEKETLSQYGVERWIELWPQRDEFPVKPWGAAWNISTPTDTDYAVLYKTMEEITRRRIPEIILAEPAEFDALWDEYMTEIEENGVEKMEDEYETFVKARIEHWGGSVGL